MAFRVQAISIDLLNDRGMIALQNPESGAHINIAVPIDRSGGVPGSELKELVLAAARQGLQEAMQAL